MTAMRVMLFIGTLRTGGAEAQMVRLSEGLAGLGVDVDVVTMFPGGQFWHQMQAADGVRPRSLYPSVARTRVGRVLQILGAPRRLRREIREARPTVLLSSLYLSNLVAFKAWREDRPCPLIWSIRCSTIPTTIPRSLYFTSSRRRVGQVAAVIYNSYAGLTNHLAAGFPESGAQVILNGIDSVRFRPDEARGEAWRQGVGLPLGAPVVGVAARLVEMKDHSTFLKAMARVTERHPEARGACIGGGNPAFAQKLRATAQSLGLEGKVVWAGEVQDMVGAYNGLDFLVSSSSAGEAFSNSIGEAMACGRPCVATDVGDARRILGDTGRIVPPEDPETLATAIASLLEEPPEQRLLRRRRARERIEERFSVERMVRETLELLRQQVAAWEHAGAEFPKSEGGRG